MRTLLQNGLGLAVVGLFLCYFGIYAPINQMAQGKAGVTTGVIRSSGRSSASAD